MILLFLIAAPLAELYLLFWVAENFGSLRTVGFLLFGVLAGMAVLALQGQRVWRQAQARGSLHVAPRQLLAQACVSFAGMLLILPGFLSDALAICLLIPGVRGLVLRAAFLLLGRNVQVRIFGARSSQFFRDLNRDSVIDAESRQVDQVEEKKTPNGG